MSSLLRGPAFARARGIARHVAENNVERPIARTLRVRSMLDGKAPTVLHMGDSSMLHISEHDADKRRLGEQLAGELGVRSAQFYGPGYSPALFAELIRLVADRTPPRCVVVSLGLRTSTHRHVIDHPIFGYQRSIASLRRARAVNAGLLARAVKRTPSREEYTRFESIARSSRWGRATTVGEYRRLLRDYDPRHEGDERQAVLFDYFHGEYTTGSPGLADWRVLGERLRALGAPVVAYRSWMPMGNGARLLGNAFTEHVEANFALVEDAFFDGLGHRDQVELAPLPDDQFINPADGTEHLNEGGRLAVVAALAPAVRNELRPAG